MAMQLINNSETGLSVRTKINENFDELETNLGTLAQEVLDNELICKYWAVQTFNLSSQNNVTLSSNENKDVPSAPENVINSSAVLTDLKGNPVGVFGFRREVTAHTALAVTFNGNVSGNVKVWWLQTGKPPTGSIIAPKFVRDNSASYYDDNYVNQIGDETISGLKSFSGNIDGNFGINNSVTYNGDNTLNVLTTANGTKTMSYLAGKLIGIVGTGIYKSWTINYDGNGRFLSKVEV